MAVMRIVQLGETLKLGLSMVLAGSMLLLRDCRSSFGRRAPWFRLRSVGHEEDICAFASHRFGDIGRSVAMNSLTQEQKNEQEGHPSWKRSFIA